MAIRNAFKGGTDWTEETLEADDINDTFNSFYFKLYADNTGGNSTSTSEITHATATISDDDLDSSGNLLITAAVRYDDLGSGGSHTGTFRLKIDGSTVKTITLSGNASNRGSVAATFTYLDTGRDFTSGDIDVTVTGQTDEGTSNARHTVNSLIVMGTNDNS